MSSGGDALGNCSLMAMEADDDDADFDDVDWEDDEEFQQPAPCLFCGEVIPHLDQILEHLTNKHNLNLLTLKKKFNMDCYSYIKLINYIRTHKSTPETIMASKDELWNDSKYLKPVMQDDPWLMFDFEDLEVPSSSNEDDGSTKEFVANAEDGVVTLSSEHFWQLQKKAQELQMQLAAAEEKVAQMKALTHNLVTDDASSKATGSMEADVGSGVASLELSEDRSYFDCYAHYAIHQEMLLDRVRTESYRDALLLNPSVLQGKKVLDLGCGSSILSMFAVKAGASAVVGIDQSDIIYTAMDIIRENSMEKQIQLLKGRIEDTNIPFEKVDVIVSEWMGYFLLFEGMLDSFLYARDKHLAPGGSLLPNKCSLYLVGVHDTGRHETFVGFWKDVYGFKMTSLGKESFREPRVEVLDPCSVVTSVHTIVTLNLMTCTLKDYETIYTQFCLEALHATVVTALAGYFDVFFNLPDQPVQFSTGPQSVPTHWKQVLFYLQEPIPMTKGEKLVGDLTCRRQRKNLRSLEVDITVRGKKYSYNLN